MDAQSIFSSIPNNPLYVKRYFRYLEACAKLNYTSSPSYLEAHHILPASIWCQYQNFSKFPENQILLTVRQHIYVHYILTKCFVNKREHFKMSKAFLMTNISNPYQLRSKNESFYQAIKEKQKLNLSLMYSGDKNPFYGRKHSEETRKKLSESHKGKKHKEETKAKIAKANKGKKRNEEFCKQASEKMIGNKNAKGSKRNEISKQRMSKAQSGANNPSAIEYNVINPKGELFKVKGLLKKFCLEHNLSYQKMKVSINSGKIEIKNLQYKRTERVLNCIDWKISTSS